jgi:hypothetical protein
MARAGLHVRVDHESHERHNVLTMPTPEMATSDAHDMSCPKREHAREEVNACHRTSILRRSGGDTENVAARPHRAAQGGDDTRSAAMRAGPGLAGLPCRSVACRSAQIPIKQRR